MKKYIKPIAVSFLVLATGVAIILVAVNKPALGDSQPSKVKLALLFHCNASTSLNNDVGAVVLNLSQVALIQGTKVKMSNGEVINIHDVDYNGNPHDGNMDDIHAKLENAIADIVN